MHDVRECGVRRLCLCVPTCDSQNLGHFRNPEHRFWPLDILREAVYDARGNELRLAALRTMVLGAIALVVVSVLCFMI